MRTSGCPSWELLGELVGDSPQPVGVVVVERVRGYAAGVVGALGYFFRLRAVLVVTPGDDTTEPEHRRLVRGSAVAFAHNRGPPPPARPVLGDLLETVPVGVEKERDLRGELVDAHPAPLEDRVAVGDAVGQRERHLLNSVGARVAEMRAGH